MTYPITIEPGGRGFLARDQSGLNADGTTVVEAAARLTAADLAPLMALPDTPNPIAAVAGHLKGHPLFDDYVRAIAEAREAEGAGVTGPPFVLDTDAFTLYEHGAEPLTGRVLARPVGQVGLTVISVDESLTGWYTLTRRAKTPEQVEFAYAKLATAAVALSRFPLVPFDRPAITEFDRLRRSKLNIRLNDLRIAAIARVRQLTVITRNRRDFDRVPGLRVED